MRLRLNQRLVSQRQIGGDLPGTDRVGLDHIDQRPVRELDRERADGGVGRVGVPLRIGVQRSLRVENQLRRLGADQFNTIGRVDRGLVGVIGSDADVHQLRQQVDRLIALIHQRRGGRVGWLQSPQLGVDLRDLGHRGIGLTHRNVDVLLGIGTQRLNALRRRIELLRQRLRRRHRRDLRRWIPRVRR